MRKELIKIGKNGNVLFRIWIMASSGIGRPVLRNPVATEFLMKYILFLVLLVKIYCSLHLITNIENYFNKIKE
jgi:hypothetical protein